ncbi:protein YIPF5 homolog [Anopheles marshallii]|uniref:protein YIPF5 homolog n=1 Tax=Anopheles marshallii TaxID=1521116 RepID=UPI00237BBBEB|nr:protein YIPF5 homolog [Anopheles marshallii]
MSNQSDSQYWTNQTEDLYDGFTEKSQMLDFQTLNPNEMVYWNDSSQPDPVYNSLPEVASCDPYGMMIHQQNHYGLSPLLYTSNYYSDYNGTGSVIEANEFDELPLLEELEIYPRRILGKAMEVLNPFQGYGPTVDTPDYLFQETDLAGPIMFCLTLAACLSISNSKAQFGYIYGLSTISVLAMYCLIWLMCQGTEWHVTVSGVASVLGYSMLTVVFLAVIGLFTSLNNLYGVMLAGTSILLATVHSSRMFCLMTGDPNQRYLLAYPCSLLFTIFAMLVLF